MALERLEADIAPVARRWEAMYAAAAAVCASPRARAQAERAEAVAQCGARRAGGEEEGSGYHGRALWVIRLPRGFLLHSRDSLEVCACGVRSQSRAVALGRTRRGGDDHRRVVSSTSPDAGPPTSPTWSSTSMT